MIIVIGPDGSGKTTLAKELSKKYSLPYFHYTKDSTYDEYIRDSCALNWKNAVLDRHAICELPYSEVMGREFRFTMKEWHNILLITLIQNPVIVLCVHKPLEYQYDKGQYLPYGKWDRCLQLYRDFLESNKIACIHFDYVVGRNLKWMADLSTSTTRSMDWWEPMWTSGWGCVGSPNPKVLLVAERIGPNNTHSIPFETGPTGLMLSDLLRKTGTPLGRFAVTNLVKSWRRDSREPNDEDMRLLGIELD